jgi:hypothetical protein
MFLPEWMDGFNSRRRVPGRRFRIVASGFFSVSQRNPASETGIDGSLGPLLRGSSIRISVWVLIGTTKLQTQGWRLHPRSSRLPQSHSKGPSTAESAVPDCLQCERVSESGETQTKAIHSRTEPAHRRNRPTRPTNENCSAPEILPQACFCPS